MQELERGIRDLHDQVGRLDDMLREGQVNLDLSERLSAAAAEQAEAAQRLAVLAHDLMRRVAVALVIGLALWTPVVAYGAIWFHELVRNGCYPAFVMEDDRDEYWYCGIFPGTNRHPAH